MKIQELTENRFVFSAVLDKGVPTVPDIMVDIAEEAASLIGRETVCVGGTCSKVWFDIKPELTEEELADAEGLLESRGLL